MNLVSEKLSKIASITSKKNLCDSQFKDEKKTGNGILTSVNGLMDEVDLEVKLENGITTDFIYNIQTSFDGTARESTTKQWQVIHGLETSIISAMKSAANTCSLDIPIASIDGRTARILLKEMIIYNRKVEYYFKNVAWGSITRPEWVNGDDALFATIAAHYSPWATAWCKNEYGFDEVIAKFQGEIEKIGKWLTDSLEWWKKAIRMFQWTEGTQAEQDALAQKLLMRELSRQWLSQSAQSIMLGNLSCFQSSTNKDSTIEERIKARTECGEASTEWMWWGIQQSFIAGFTQDYAKKNPTTEKYLNNTLKFDRAKVNVENMSQLWSTIDTTLSSSDETTINAQLFSDLVSMHVQLVMMNKLLKQKIPAMQKNCMKENPGVVGACK